MPAVCAVCGKSRKVANNVSHSNIKSKTVQKVNLHRVRMLVGQTPRRMKVCTRCLRSGAVRRPLVSAKR